MTGARACSPAPGLILPIAIAILLNLALRGVVSAEEGRGGEQESLRDDGTLRPKRDIRVRATP
jgi:hypothetical protein